jgi:hypothetical protein
MTWDKAATAHRPRLIAMIRHFTSCPLDPADRHHHPPQCTRRTNLPQYPAGAAPPKPHFHPPQPRPSHRLACNRLPNPTLLNLPAPARSQSPPMCAPTLPNLRLKRVKPGQVQPKSSQGRPILSPNRPLPSTRFTPIFNPCALVCLTWPKPPAAKLNLSNHIRPDSPGLDSTCCDTTAGSIRPSAGDR